MNNGYLILDIETIPNQHIPAPVFDESTVALGNTKDPEKIALKIIEAGQAFDEGLTKKMSIEHDLCEIVSLGVIEVSRIGEIENLDTFYYNDGDAAIVQKFRELFLSDRTLITWGGKRFDIPVLWKRSMFHGKLFTDALSIQDLTTPWRNNRHIDLMLIFNAGGMGKLSEACKFLGLECKVGMDGSMVYNAFKEGREKDIRAYNLSDCMSTYLVAKRCGIIMS
jgi:predicted PolB exonuclease-like 3'-5' exonuclease